MMKSTVLKTQTALAIVIVATVIETLLFFNGLRGFPVGDGSVPLPFPMRVFCYTGWVPGGLGVILSLYLGRLELREHGAEQASASMDLTVFSAVCLGTYFAALCFVFMWHIG